jgi:SagB-type dehydrogenase family enzyme
MVDMEFIDESRRFLRADLWEEFENWETDQKRGIPHPPPQEPYPEDARLIDLIAPEALDIGEMALIEVINRRRSRRKYTKEPLTLKELSFLLWATQGVQRVIQEGVRVYRTVPSGGARHSFETYLMINRVTGIEPGLYRYLSMEHRLCLLYSENSLDEKIADACRRQSFIKDAAVVFLWTTIPYRMEWRYGPIAHKAIAMDAGHLCQNLYLASEAIGAGTCAIGAYTQEKIDAILGVDGKEEFTIYVASVGKLQ